MADAVVNFWIKGYLPLSEQIIGIAKVTRRFGVHDLRTAVRVSEFIELHLELMTTYR